MQLNPASYYYKDVKSPTRPAWGFIAQEVQKIFPELVHQSMDYMGLNYNDFAVMAIKGLQEQQQEISTLKLEAKRRESENKVLQNRLSELEVMVQKLMDQKQQKEAIPLLIQSPSLGQNSPNPASEMTRVEYFLPKGKSGELRITNIKGQHLKQIILPKTGKGYVDLQTHNLPAGTYTYSLIINGQTIDTKRMVLNH